MKRREGCYALRIRRHDQLSAVEALPMADDAVDPVSREAWHLWFIVFPRRSITGKLVRGLVWRRRKGPQWIYKNFTGAEPPANPASPPLADAHTPDRLNALGRMHRSTTASIKDRMPILGASESRGSIKGLLQSTDWPRHVRRPRRAWPWPVHSSNWRIAQLRTQTTRSLQCLREFLRPFHHAQANGREISAMLVNLWIACSIALTVIAALRVGRGTRQETEHRILQTTL